MKKLIYLLTVVFLLATVLTAAIYIKAGWPVLLPLCITSGTFSYHFAMRLIVGSVFQICMRNRADYRKWWYRQKKWESRFYKRINVRKWKRFMPTYETSLFDPGVHTWDEIVQAMCQAELVHETIVVLSFLPVIASVWLGAAAVFLITSLAAAAFDLMFVMMQRYNRGRVIRLVEREK